MIIGERALWFSVLMQAAHDLSKEATNLREEIEWERTAAWINGDDLIEVCDLADICPIGVRRGMKRVMKKRGNFGKQICRSRHRKSV